MTEEQLQKFYAMAEPRSENAIRKAEERKKKREQMPAHEEVLTKERGANMIDIIVLNHTPKGVINLKEMNYEKMYKDALERARDLMTKQNPPAFDENLIGIVFPELKESKDEMIRKWLIDWAKAVNWSEQFTITKEQVLAWLEKQKREEAKEVVFRPAAGYSIDIAVLQALKKQRESRGNIVLAFNGVYIPVDDKTADEIVAEYHKWLKKQGVQKPADKVEAEFHEGDWIVLNETVYQITEIDDSHVVLSFNGRECKFGLEVLNNAQKFESQFKVGDWIVQENIGIYKVIEVCESWYEVVDNKDEHYSISFNKEYMCHLWTIQDAKDGDVLINWNNTTFIFKAIEDETVKFHIAYNEKWDTIKTPSTKLSHLGLPEPQFEFHPATKEQHDLLFQKMKEAGYEWDAQKKELKKIKIKSENLESKSLDADRVIEWLNDQACLGWLEDIEVDKFIGKFKRDFGL